jgi:hypothetical protein
MIIIYKIVHNMKNGDEDFYFEKKIFLWENGFEFWTYLAFT